MIDETIIGYMEDEEHNDQDTCMMIIWWFRNYHNYLIGGMKFMFSSLLVCRSVFLSLSSPSLWLSPSVPSSLRPPLPTPTHTTPIPTPVTSTTPTPTPIPTPFPSLSLSLSLSLSHTHTHMRARTLSLSLFHSPALSQHGKLGTKNMFVCSVPRITEKVSITTYFHKISSNNCSTFSSFSFHSGVKQRKGCYIKRCFI